MTDRQSEVERAHLAAEILSNPLWAEVWSVWEARMHSEWASTKADDVQGREELWRMLRVAQKVQADVRAIFDTGRMASQQLQKEAENARRKTGNETR